MNSHPHQQSRKYKQHPKQLYRWHRRIGATAALFIVWLVISGWLLNHSASLNLAQHKIHSPALAHWYGLNYQAPTQTFNSKNYWLVGNSEILIVNGKTLSLAINTTAGNTLVGIAESENFIAVANRNNLLLLSPQGDLIDKLSNDTLPIKGITQIGTGCSGIVVANATQILATADGINWQQPCEQNIAWSVVQNITPEQLQQIEPLLAPEISIEKVIIDLHTGLFFGRYGAYVVDTVGACLMLLALSGLWLFFRMGQKK
jgi:hypothetical protein